MTIRAAAQQTTYEWGDGVDVLETGRLIDVPPGSELAR
jgi:hypothetical protein